MRDVGGGFFLRRFWSGAAFAATGIGFTFKHRALLMWAIIPMLVQAALFAVFLAGGLYLAVSVVQDIRPEPGHWYTFTGALLYAAAVILVVVGSVLASLFVGSVVCDPFYDKLSEVTESILVGRDVSTSFSIRAVLGGIVTEGLVTLLRIGVYLGGELILFLIGLTGIGSLVAVPLSLAWTWMFVALESWWRSLARHGVPGKARIGALFGMPSVALGFGAVGWLLAYIPMTMPFLVVSGTRLYLALAAHGRIESSLSDDDKRALRAAT